MVGATVNDVAVEIDLTLNALRTLLDNGPASVVVDLRSDLADASYNGSLQLGDAVQVDGAFDVSVPSLAPLAQFADVDLPIDSGVVGRLTAKGSVEGTLDRLNIALDEARQDGAFSETQFTGSVELAETPVVQGSIDAKVTDLRGLAAAFDVVLTGTDAIYRSARLRASVATEDTTYKATGLRAELDRMTVTGDASFRGNTRIPYIQANLTSDGTLDLTPYTLASSDSAPPGTGSDPGWSKAPLDLSALSSVNADFTLETPELILDKLEVDDARLKGKLANGVLDLNVERATSFGGAFSGVVTVEGEKAPTPTVVTANFTGEGVSAGRLVSTFSGYDVIVGQGGFNIENVRASGASMDALVRSLQGNISADLNDGALKGINLAQLYRTAEQALISGSIPAALSPETEISRNLPSSPRFAMALLPFARSVL